MMIPRNGWTIAWIGDIEIKVNFSLFFIAVLVTASLALSILPHNAPGADSVFYWLVGLLTALVFIGSILWHELAHAFVALHYHIPVIQIVLHLFGGVAQIARNPERPGQEFWIAIAGPASSLVLAIMFWMLSALGGVPGAASTWLAVVNLTLALFNLLPGFPLDGGRVLRSALWYYGGSFRLATRQASRVGQGIAGLFVLMAIWQTLNGDVFDGIWFILIAAFLYSAASSSYQSARGESLSMNTPVRKVMRFNVPTVEPTMRLALLAWKYLDHARDQAFPVMDNGELVGLISAIQVDKIPRLEWGKYTVSEIMVPRDMLTIIASDEAIQKAFIALEQAGMDHAPVYDGIQFVGMLNRRDIVYRT
jgi:Zn-dependent protease/predicted transcriptional regulator